MVSSQAADKTISQGAGNEYTMSDSVRVVLSESLSPKWRDVALRLGAREAAVTTYNGPPKGLLAHCRRLAPCVLVAPDKFFDRVNSEEFCHAADFGRSVRVIVEVREDDPFRAEQLVRIGCAGLLSRDATVEQALRALDAVLDGELWLSRKMVSSTLRKLLCEAKHHLTYRESQILSLLSENLKNGEIARRLFISPETVRWHLRSLYNKLGTHDRATIAVREPSERKPEPVAEADLDLLR